jgi:hypothetical protein
MATIREIDTVTHVPRPFGAEEWAAREPMAPGLTPALGSRSHRAKGAPNAREITK